MTEEIKEEQATEVVEEPTVPSVDELQAQIESLKAEVAQTEKLKKSVSEACADAAEWKRKYRATLDENERNKQEQAEKQASMESELNSYRTKERVNTYFAKLVSSGYTPEVAQEMASGLPEGVPDSFFENQRAFLEAKTQEIKKQILNSQPTLSTGMPPVTTVDSQEQEDMQMRKWFGLK